MTYDKRLILRLLGGRTDAWLYVARRWPGIRELDIQGSFGLACELPGDRVIKFTADSAEIATARRVRREKPVGVVRVLSVGKHHYVMPKLVPGKRGAIPHAPYVTHMDCSPSKSMHCRNIMKVPGTGEHVYIDLDGLKFLTDTRVRSAKRGWPA